MTDETTLLSLSELLLRSTSLINNGEVTEADRLLTAAIRSGVRDSRVYSLMGILATAVGNTPIATKSFQSAVADSPSAEHALSYCYCLLADEKQNAASTFLGTFSKKTELSPELLDIKRICDAYLGDPSEPEVVSSELTLDSKLWQELEDLADAREYDRLLSSLRSLTEEDKTSHKFYTLLGKGYLGLKKPEDALKAFSTAKGINCSDIMVHLNCVQACLEMGKFEIAEQHLIEAKSQFPRNPLPSFNLGNIYRHQRKNELALHNFLCAHLLNKIDAETCFKVAESYKSLQQYGLAIGYYKRCLTLKQDHLSCWNNLGNLYQDLGKRIEAEKCYLSAISSDRTYIIAYFNLGNNYRERGELLKALKCFTQCFKLDPNYSDALRSFAELCKVMEFNSYDDDVVRIFSKLLESNGLVRPHDISAAIASMLKFEPKIQYFLQRDIFCLKPFELIELIIELSCIDILNKYMRVTPIVDLAFEEFFASVRKALLLNLENVWPQLGGTTFLSSFILQVNINEFLYEVSEEESIILLDLKNSFETKPVNVSRKAVLLALYEPIHDVNGFEALLIDTPLVKKKVIDDKVHELRLANELSSLSDLDDFSKRVQAQYEQNPYPRWENLILPKTTSVGEYARARKLNFSSFKFSSDKKLNILIAGCGTGQHSIGSALRFSNSYVTAFDISKRSVAYAMIKSKELGVDNISYHHGDILKLEFPQKFDVIESSGVLHHMADPIEGWRALYSHLKENGLMSIGLYSTRAREHIKEIRNRFAGNFNDLTPREIKRLRQKFILTANENSKSLLRSPDFYSVSGVRDLLFHVNEHTFTVVEIQEALNELGLKFCGFDHDVNVRRFISEFGEENLYNLSSWDAFEAKYTRSFAGMFQFWCQKI